MNLYLLLNLIILAFPLALSFDKKVAYFRRWPRVISAAMIVGAAYLVWDVLVTEVGHWSFNEEYAGSVKLLGLPPGEYLFFLTVPFSCLFIYEVVRAYFRERRVSFGGWIRWGLIALSVAGAVLFRNSGYTLIVFSAVGVFAALTWFIPLFSSFHFWLYFALSMIPFLLFNGILTAMPVVRYGSDYILDVRVYTIPLEDFFYNFTLLGFNAFVFDALKKEKSPEKVAVYG